MTDDATPHVPDPQSTVEATTPAAVVPPAVTDQPLDPASLQLRAAQLLNHGETRIRAVEILQQQGAKTSDASHAVDSAHQLLSQHQAAQQPDGGDVVRALLGALVAAIIAGVAWGAIVWQTNYEIGFAALGVGWLVGRAVLLATGNKRGRQLQVVAVLASVLGIMLGKYMTVYFVLRDHDVPVKLIDSNIVQYMRDNPDTVFSLIDIVFFVVAVLYAARQVEPRTTNFRADAT